MNRLVRRLLTLPLRRKTPPSARRPRPLDLLRLEDRAVPAAVAPGSSWSDSYTAPTVTVRNTGAGWLEVSGGAGSAFVSPGTPPSGGGGGGVVVVADPDGPVSPPPAGTDPNAGYYGFEVSGNEGDVTWTGDAKILSVKATGDVSPIGIGGTLWVDAGRTVGNVSGRTVTAKAGMSVGNVSATDDVLSVTAGTTVGTVNATDDVFDVRAGTALGAVTAGGDVVAVYAGTNTAGVTAAGWVGTVSAGRDVGGMVKAGLWVGGAYAPGGSSNWQYATYYGGVSAGRDVTQAVEAGRGVVGVSAGRDVLGPVTAKNGDIWMVRAGGGGEYTGGGGPVVAAAAGPQAAATTGGGGTFVPYPPGRVVGAVTASRDVVSVIATGDQLGKVTAQAGFVFTVNADGSATGGVSAATDIGVRTARTPDADWRPSYQDPFTVNYWADTWAPRGIGVVAVAGDVAGGVEAKAGDVRYAVRAGRDILGAVKAGKSVGLGTDEVAVVAGRAFDATVTAGVDVGAVYGGTKVAGAITAGRDVGTVTANGYDATTKAYVSTGADVTAAITAGRDVLGVAAYRGSVGGKIAATAGSVGNVSAQARIGGATANGVTITAGQNVADLTTDRGDISALVTATNGSIGKVTAGSLGGGKISGNLSAKTTIAEVVAYGAGGRAATLVNGYRSLPAPELGRTGPGLTATPWGTIDPAADVYTPLSLPTDKPAKPVYAAGGDITGAVTAGGNIGPVVAVGAVRGPVTSSAGALLQGVWAYGPVAGAITSAAGGLTVRTWDRVEPTGRVTGSGPVAAFAYDDLAGDLKSTAGTVTAGSWDDADGAADGYQSVDVRALGGAGPAGGGKKIISQTGWVRVAAGKSVGSATEAQGYVAVRAGESITGGLTSRTSDVWAEAVQSVTVSAADGGDDIWVAALGGTAAGAFTARNDQARVWAATDIAGTVTAKTDADVYAYNSVTAPVVVTDGVADVWAMGDVTGGVRAMWYARVEAGESVKGKVEAGDPSRWATAHVTARRDVTADVTASGDLQVWAGRHSTGKVAATLGTARVIAVGNVGGEVRAGWDAYAEAAGAVSAPVTAGLNATVRAGGDLTGAITAEGDVFADISGNVGAAVKATNGSVDLVSLKQVGGDVTAGHAAKVRAWGVAGKVGAGELAQVTSFGPVGGSVTSARADVVVYAEGDVTGAVSARGNASVRSLGSVTGGVLAGNTGTIAAPAFAADGWATADVFAEGDVSGGVRGAWAAAVDAGGAIDGEVRAGRGAVTAIARAPAEADLRSDGTVDLVALAGYSGTVTAYNTVSMDVFGVTNATVATTAGSIKLWGSGAVDGKYTALGNVEVVALASVTATVVAGNDTTASAAHIEAMGDAIVDVTGSDRVTVSAGGKLGGSVASTRGSVLAFAVGDVTASVRAAADATLMSHGAVGVQPAGSTAVTTLAAGGDVVVYAGGDMAAGVTTNGGRVGVWAHGAVTGSLVARAGADVTADRAFTGSLTMTSPGSGPAAIRSHGNVGGLIKLDGQVSVVAGGAFTGRVESRLGGVTVAAAGAATGVVVSGGAKTVRGGVPLTVGRLVPVQWVVDRIVDLSADPNAGQQFVAAAAAPPGAEVKVVGYSLQPGTTNKWNIMVYDRQGVGTKLSDGNFPSLEAVQKFLAKYAEDQADVGVKVIAIRLCQVALDKQAAAAKKAYEDEMAAGFKRSQELQEAAERAEAAKREAERQQQAKADVDKKIADQKLRLQPRLEQMPDGSQRWVTPQQDKGVRATLDRPGGLGGQLYVIEGGRVTPTGDLYQPTALEYSQALKQAYLGRLEAEERANPEVALDRLQTMLDVAGLIPVVGIPFDIANAGVSFFRADALGAGLSLLGVLPVVGDAAQGAKVAKRGVDAAAAAGRAGKTAERAAAVLKNADEAAEIVKAQDEAKLLLAAALETGYKTNDEVKAALQAAGRSADEAEAIIKQAREAAAQGGARFTLAKQYMGLMKSGLVAAWSRIDPAYKALALKWEKDFLAALKGAGAADTKIVVNKPYTLLADGSGLTDDTLVALSVLNKAEHAVTRTEKGYLHFVRGTRAEVRPVVRVSPENLPTTGKITEFIHTQPGVRNVVPSLEDLDDAALLGVPVTVLARGTQPGTFTKITYSPDEVRRLYAILSTPPETLAANEMMKRFFTAVSEIFTARGIVPPDSMLAQMSALGMRLP